MDPDASPAVEQSFLGRLRRAVTAFPLPDRVVVSWWLMAILGAGLRSITLRESLWLDELHTSWAVKGSCSDVLDRAAEGNQTPVYFWLVWLLVRIVGHSEVVLRMISWIAGSMLIVSAARLTRIWTGSAILSTLTAVLVLLDPHCIYFSREARPYAFLQWLVIGHLLAFTSRWNSGEDKGRWLWILSAIVMFYTHVTSSLVVFAEFVFVGVQRGRKVPHGPHARVWLIDGTAIAGAWMLALPLLRALAERRSNWLAFVREPRSVDLVSLFAWVPYGLVPLILLVIVACTKRSSLRRWNDSQRSYALLTILWYAIPAIMTWFVTKWGVAPLFFRRYLMSSAIAWMMWPASVGVILAKPTMRVGFAVVVLLAAAIVHTGRSDRPYTKHSWEDWRGALAWLEDPDQKTSWPVLLRAGLIEDQNAHVDPRPLYQAYLRFPLDSLYAYRRDVAQATVVPREWSSGERLPWGSIRRAGGCLLLARGDARSLQFLHQNLQSAALRERITLVPQSQFQAGRVVAIAFRASTNEKH